MGTPATTMLPSSERQRARALAVATFIFVGVAAVDSKLWILWHLAHATDQVILRWVPVAVAGDLLLGGLFACLAALSLRLPRWRRVAVGAVVCTAVAAVVLNTGNILKYAIDENPLTLADFLGAQGGTLADLDLVEPGDLFPVVAAALAHLALAPVALRLGRRVARWRLVDQRGALVLTLLVAVPGLVAGIDRLWWADSNFDVGRQPVLTFLASLGEAPPTTANVPTGGDALPSASEWSALLRARGEDGRTAPPERTAGAVRNVILIYAEGIPRELTSLADATLGSTPNLLRRTRADGVELPRYHASMHRSIGAIFEAACSDYASPDGVSITYLNPRIDCGELSEVMASHGVTPGLFHSGPFAFYDKLRFLGRRAYAVEHDSITLAKPGVWSHRWGIDDRATVDEILAWIDTLGGARFAAWFIPIAAHYPFSVPPDLPPASSSSSHDKLLASIFHMDVSFERLMLGLEARGLADETMVIFVADHGSPDMLRRRRATRGARIAYENNLSVPAVILAPAIVRGGQQSARLGSHVDLLPTMLDAMGLPPDPRHQGRSLIGEAWAPRRHFVSANLATGSFVGVIDGDRKWIAQVNSRRRELYDLALDPNERKNLWDREPGAEETVHDALRFLAWQPARLQRAPRRNDDFDVAAAIARSARVVVRQGAQERECLLEDEASGARRCQGLPAETFGGRARARVLGQGGAAERECLLLRPPPGAEITIDADVGAGAPPVYLAIAGRLEGAAPAGTFRVSLAADDFPRTSTTLSTKSNWTRVHGRVPRTHAVVTVAATGDQTADLCLALDERAWFAVGAGDDDAAAD